MSTYRSTHQAVGADVGGSPSVRAAGVHPAAAFRF